MNSWLDEVPDAALWGVGKWEDDAERRRRLMFDLDEWIAAGRKVPHIESELIRVLELQKSERTLYRAAFALGKLKSHAAVPVLIEQLDSQDAALQIQAADALGTIGDAKAVHPIGARLSQVIGQDDALVASMVDALANIDDDAALRMLKRLANEEDPVVSDLARYYLSAIESKGPRKAVQSFP